MSTPQTAPEGRELDQIFDGLHAYIGNNDFYPSNLKRDIAKAKAEVKQLLAAHDQALIQRVRDSLPKKVDTVPAATDLYERAEQLGHADGVNVTIDAVTTILDSLEVNRTKPVQKEE
jgi:2,3-bisphosphoglycerate-independent phosphoglycerate mutase